MTRNDWKQLYALRDDLEDRGDRALLRRFIKHVERLEKVVTVVRSTTDRVMKETDDEKRP